MSIEWGSFLLGGLVSAFFVGPIGILIGGLVRMAGKSEKQSTGISDILREASIALPKGEIVNLTIGHDVFVTGPDEEDQENFWERN